MIFVGFVYLSFQLVCCIMNVNIDDVECVPFFRQLFVFQLRSELTVHEQQKDDADYKDNDDRFKDKEDQLNG